jgi:large subunit ribosomal protein L31e
MTDEKKSDVAKRVKAALKAEEKKQDVAKTEEPKKDEKKEAKPVEKPKPAPKSEKKEEEKGEERIMMVPLRDAWKTPRTRRARAAIKVLRKFVARHAKRKLVLIDKSVNHAIWTRGIQKPPRRIKVKVRILKESAKVFAE